MRARAAQVKSTDQRVVTNPAQQRTHDEKLVQRQLTVEDVSAGESVRLLQIERRDDLPLLDESRQIRRIVRQSFHYRLAQSFPLFGIPSAIFQVIRGELRVHRHYVLALGRQRRIGNRGQRDIEIWVRRELAVLGVIKSSLQVINIGANVQSPGEKIAVFSIFKRGELRQSAEREINFGRSSDAAIVAQLNDEIRLQIDGIEQLQQRAPGISVGNDRRSWQLFPALQDYAA